MEGYLPLKVGDAFLYYRQHFNDPEIADPKRSLFVCRLDRKLKAKTVTELFQQCGPIDTVQTGKMEKSSAAKGTSPGNFVFFAVLTFKKKTSLRNALRQGWLQSRLDGMQTEEQPENAALQQHIEKMEEGGFHMVLPKSKNPSALFNASSDATAQSKKKERYAEDFYNFQVHPPDAAPQPVKKPRTS